MSFNPRYSYFSHIEAESALVKESVAEYQGEKQIQLACTQLDNKTAKEQSKIVDEWCRLFTHEKLPLKRIWVVSRISQKIFDALCQQTQLNALWIKWGVYPELGKITGLNKLQFLHLGNGTSIQDLSPLASLKNLLALETDGLVNVHDYNFLPALHKLEDLAIEGDGLSSMKAVVLPNLHFLEKMPQLVRLSLIMTKTEDKDYAPILKIKNLKWLALPHFKEAKQSEHLFKHLDLE